MRKPLMRMLFYAFLVTSPLRMAAQNTFPVNDVANPMEGCYAFINATIVKDAQTTLQNATLVIRKGKVEKTGTGFPLPKDAVVIDCRGKYIYPSFIDVYTDYGIAPMRSETVAGPGRSTQMLSNTKGAVGWNQAIKSETDAAALFTVNETRAKELRGMGIGVVLTHQMDGISRGTGAVVTLANDKENQVILKEKASANFSFDKGSSTQDYPTSLMGAITLLRQNFLDARWYKSAPATEGTNLSLQAFLNNQSLPQFFESTDKWSDLRADKIGDEFGVQYIIKGSGNEYQRINEIKATNAAFILPVNFPQAMDVEDPTDARYISLADLKHWEMAAVNPAAFEKATINFAITSNGLRENNAFLSNIRKAIQAGLSEQKALDALTKTPATLINMYDKVGSLDAGKLANFLITSGPLFAERTVIFQNWVQGARYLVKEEGWKDSRGTYKLVINNQSYSMEIKGEAAKPTATLAGTDSAKVDLVANERLVKLTIGFKKDSTAVIRLSGVMGDTQWGGTGQLSDGKWVSWTASKTGETKSTSDSSRRRRNETAAKIDGEITYPFNGYGYKKLPAQQNVLIKNATVWTSEKEGKLTNTDVLVKNGKIASIGKNLSDATAKTIDGTGKHLSAGIIDEHSHIAGTGGINECSQSVTAETR